MILMVHRTQVLPTDPVNNPHLLRAPSAARFYAEHSKEHSMWVISFNPHHTL